MDVRYVSCEGVAEMIQGPAKEEIAIVDVRDRDEIDSMVRGAINVESGALLRNDAAVDALLQQLQNKQKVVMHCALSMQRGPACAARLASRLAELGQQGPAVLVMQGGFNRYGAVFGSDPQLVQRPGEQANGGKA